MDRCFWIFVLALVFSGSVFAHGGGIDKCGGHKDRKQGDYHVHDQAKYCVCHPRSENCGAKPDPGRRPAPASPRSKP